MTERGIWLDKQRDGVEYTLEMARYVMMEQPDIANQPKRIETVAKSESVLETGRRPHLQSNHTRADAMAGFDIVTTKNKTTTRTSRVVFLWLPRYHPEFMPVERVWAMTKSYAKCWCSYDIRLLMMVGGIIDTAVARIKTHHVRAFIQLAERYVLHYHAGCVGVPPGKIRRVGYDLMVSQGIATAEQVEKWRIEDRLSLDAEPQCLQLKKSKKKRTSSAEKKAHIKQSVAAVKEIAKQKKKSKSVASM